MVVKTLVCNFSEHKIYPGKGIQAITKESKILTFIHKKAKCHYSRKIRSQKIKWTTAWRRLNKKTSTGDDKKKKKKRAAKIVRDIVGLDMEVILQR
jgi:large subunit ribosomal protein L24e